MNLSKREKSGLCVFGAIILILISYMYFSNRKSEEIAINTSRTPEAEASVMVSPTPSPEEKEEIRVYICGAVKSPGIYTLLEGDRIETLLDMAGGVLEEADLSAINPAEKLQDEQYIKVPFKGEDVAVNIPAGTGASRSKGKVNINTAGAEELDTLPGVGPATALKIISYRQEHGKFTDTEQIKNVKGIGDSKYDELKNFICVK